MHEFVVTHNMKKQAGVILTYLPVFHLFNYLFVLSYLWIVLELRLYALAAHFHSPSIFSRNSTWISSFIHLEHADSGNQQPPYSVFRDGHFRFTVLWYNVWLYEYNSVNCRHILNCSACFISIRNRMHNIAWISGISTKINFFSTVF